MSKYHESKIAIEAVKVVEEFGELTMSELIYELIKRMKPTGHDMAIIPNRNDSYFSQKVRNLKSHNNSIFFSNVNYDKNEGKYISKEFSSLKSKLGRGEYDKKLEKRNKCVEQFYANKYDFEIINKEKKEIGDKGEKLVLEDQKKIVSKILPGYVKNIRHVAKLDGDGAGYDISSFDKNKEIKYIEVKSTKYAKETPFYMSETEYRFYQLHKENYIIARVYNLNLDNGTGDIEYINGSDLKTHLKKQVSVYKFFYK